jgi:biotin-(acetyl-CoA carboxylase) ligase
MIFILTAKKIAGLLSELQGEGGMLVWIALGLGININNVCTVPDVINYKKLAGHPVSRREALLAILGQFR